MGVQPGITVASSVTASDAWPDGSFKEVEVQQPPNTIIDKIVIRAISAPTFGASGSTVDCGLKVSTTEDGGEILDDADGLIDAAADTTPIDADAIWIIDEADFGYTGAGSANTSAAATKAFSANGRSLYLQTSTTAAANTATNADVEWTVFFTTV